MPPKVCLRFWRSVTRFGKGADSACHLVWSFYLPETKLKPFGRSFNTMDVALIRWPSDEELRSELATRRHPRLLLVASDAEPPECTDVLEDWVRLPVSRADRAARIRTLESRVEHPESPAPTLNGSGTLEYRGEVTQLSAIQADLMRLLIDRFGAVVSREALAKAAWPEADRSENNLDVTMGRLRRQLGPVGLEIRTVRSRGYLLSDQSRDH